MGRQWAHESIPESSNVPADTYRLKINTLSEFEGGTSGKGKRPAGCLMYKAQLEVVEPVACAGQYVFDQFVIGTAEDPGGDDPKTWVKSVGAKLLKQLIKKARVTLTNDLDADCRNAEGNEVVAVVALTPEERNEVKRYFMLGERETGTGAQPPRGQVARPVSTPAAPGRPAQIAAPSPAPAQAASGSPGNAKTKAAPKVQEVSCPTCQVKVPRAEFQAHMDQHDADEEATAEA